MALLRISVSNVEHADDVNKLRYYKSWFLSFFFFSQHNKVKRIPGYWVTTFTLEISLFRTLSKHSVLPPPRVWMHVIERMRLKHFSLQCMLNNLENIPQQIIKTFTFHITNKSSFQSFLTPKRFATIAVYYNNTVVKFFADGLASIVINNSKNGEIFNRAKQIKLNIYASILIYTSY